MVGKETASSSTMWQWGMGVRGVWRTAQLGAAHPQLEVEHERQQRQRHEVGVANVHVADLRVEPAARHPAAARVRPARVGQVEHVAHHVRGARQPHLVKCLSGG